MISMHQVDRPKNVNSNSVVYKITKNIGIYCEEFAGFDKSVYVLSLEK